MRQCAKCGTQNAAERDFCTNCGEYLRWDPTGFMPAVPQAPAPPAAPPPGAVPPGYAPPPPPPGAAYPPPGAAYPPPQQPQYIPQAPPPQAAAPVAAEPVVITLRAAGAQAVGPPTVQVEPGSSVQLVALVRNQSGIVDNYDLHLEGLPPQWWTISPPTVYLVPYGSGGQGYEQEVTIELKPPRLPEAEARPWQFQLVAKSKAQGGARVGAGQGTLVIGPFVDFQTDVRPQKGAGRRKATFTVTVKNKANAPVEVDLTASESEESHRFEFEDEKDRVTPAPGKSAVTRVTVSPPKQRWIGGGKDIRFVVQPQVAGEQALPTAQARATFVHKAWLPQWIMFFFPIALAMAVGGFFAWKNSQSAPTYAVPDLRQIAQSEDGVSKALREAKLELGEVKEEESEDFRPGIVIKQDPEAGDKVEEGTVVNITIAVGSTIQEVPDVVGMTFEEANTAIKDAALVVGLVQPGDPDPEQPIKSQQPSPGDEAKEGSAVDLFFEEQPEESTAEDEGEGEDTAGADEGEDGEDTAGQEDTGGGEEDPATAAEEDPPPDTGGGEDTGGGDGGPGEAPTVAGKSADEAVKAAQEAGLTPVPSVIISEEAAGTVIEGKQDGDQLLLTVSGGFPQLAFDQDGDIFVADGAQGKEPQAIAQSDDLEAQPAWNADGTRIAYRRGADDESGQIWIVDPADPQSAKRLTGEGFDDRRPAFSPDGKVVAFVRGASKDVDHDLCFIGIGSTTGQPSCIEDAAENVSRPDWSPDGQSILVISSVADVQQVEATLYTTPTANSAKAGNWTRDSVVTDPMHGKRAGDVVVTAAWSPRGDQVLFTANWGKDFFHAWVAKAENGLVTGRPQPLLKVQACEASWRFDGGEIVFTERDNSCSQQGSVKRVDPKKPGEQVTLTRLVGASNPTWAPALAPADAAPPPEDRPEDTAGDELTAEVGEEPADEAPADTAAGEITAE